MIQTPWGEVQTPMAILPYFYCPKCDVDVNIGECCHNRQDFTPPLWIKQYALWLKGKFEVEGRLLEKFEWLKDNAVVFQDGFESNNYTAWTGTEESVGTIAAATDQTREGTYSSKSSISAGSGYADCYKTFSPTLSIVYSRFYMRFSSFPEANGAVWAFIDYDSVSMQGSVRIHIKRQAAGDFRWYTEYHDDTTWYTPTTLFTQGVNTNTWYCFELYRKKGSADGEIKLYQDGNTTTPELSFTSLALATEGDVNRLTLGISYMNDPGTTNWYVDSVIVDNANYIGPIQKYAFIL